MYHTIDPVSLLEALSLPPETLLGSAEIDRYLNPASYGCATMPPRFEHPVMSCDIVAYEANLSIPRGRLWSVWPDVRVCLDVGDTAVRMAESAQPGEAEHVILVVHRPGIEARISGGNEMQVELKLADVSQAVLLPVQKGGGWHAVHRATGLGARINDPIQLREARRNGYDGNDRLLWLRKESWVGFPVHCRHAPRAPAMNVVLTFSPTGRFYMLGKMR